MKEVCKKSQVYRDKLGNCSYQNCHVLTVTVLSRFYHGVVTVHVGVSRFYYGNLALSHIYVPAAYRSCIYENFNTPRSEAYFVQATYVQSIDIIVRHFRKLIDFNVFSHLQ